MGDNENKFAIVCTKIAFVEGNDEVNFFKALCKNLGVNDIQFVETGGKDRFSDEFNIWATAPGWDDVVSIAIVRDADNSTDAAFQSVASHLQKNGLPVPAAPNEFKSSSGTKYGIFIMPGNREQGMLENLVLDSLDGELLHDLSSNYIDSIQQKKDDGHDIKVPRNQPKAQLHAYLAGKDKYVPSLGLAAAKGYFNFEHEVFEPIRQFIQQM